MSVIAPRSKIISPLHIAQIGSGTLRFFAPPLPDAVELPWHVHDDIGNSIGMPPADRRGLLAMLAGGPYGSAVRTVKTGGGLVTIAPHFAAVALIGASRHVGIVDLDFEHRYLEAAIEAFKRFGGALSSIRAAEIADGARRFSLQLVAHLKGRPAAQPPGVEEPR